MSGSETSAIGVRPPVIQIVVVFLFFIVLYTLTAAGHLFSPDEEIMFRVTEAMVTSRKISIDPIVDASGKTFATRKGADGLEYAQYGLGNSLLAVPFYYAAKWAEPRYDDRKVRDFLEFETINYLPGHAGRGHALLRRFAVSFSGAFVAAATCVLIFCFAYRIFSMPPRRQGIALDRPQDEPPWMARAERRPGVIAWFTALGYGAATMAWPHARTFFSEPLATFFVLLAFYWVCCKRPHAGTCLVAGIAFALALFTRLDSVVVLPALILAVALRLMEYTSEDPGVTMSRPASVLLKQMGFMRLIGLSIVIGIPIAGFVAFQLWLNNTLFGKPFASAYADQAEGIQFTTPLLAGLYGFLFSVGKSIFLFSPMILLGLAGYVRFWRRLPAAAGACVAAAALLLLFHSRWQNWSGGWCWGPRHIFMIHVFLALPVAGYLAVRSRVNMAIYTIVLFAGIAVQLYGCSQNFIDFYMLYYRTPDKPPQAQAMYSAEDTAVALVEIQQKWSDPQQPKPLPITNLPAPINDSIYVPQNSQWQRYWDMWRMGFTDNLWLRLHKRANKQEPVLL